MRSDVQLSVELARYPAGWGQGDHVDGIDALSLVVTGRLTERCQRTTVSAGPGQVVVKPASAVHRTSFDRETVILRFEAERLFPGDAGVVSWQWLACRQMAAGLLRAAELAGSGQGDAAVDRLRDLLPDGGTACRETAAPPLWLQQLHEELADRAPEGVTVAELAAGTGLHPVHVSRIYRRHYRMTPSEALQRFRLGRALRASAIEREPLAMAAASGGFSDQSHFSRVCRRFLGVTPGQASEQVGGAGRGVGSVQSPRLQVLYPVGTTA